MITCIELSGFKTFQDFKLELAPFQVIVGANGVGKSNLFDALRLLSRLADTDLRKLRRCRTARGTLALRLAHGLAQAVAAMVWIDSRTARRRGADLASLWHRPPGPGMVRGGCHGCDWHRSGHDHGAAPVRLACDHRSWSFRCRELCLAAIGAKIERRAWIEDGVHQADSDLQQKERSLIGSAPVIRVLA